MTNYIVDGRVEREKIAEDICNGVLSKEDVSKMIENPQVKKAFFGQGFRAKKEKSEWDSNYLDHLPDYAVAEAFNEEYLYHLADVSAYLRENRTKKSSTKKLILIAAAITIAVATAVGVIALVIHLRK